MRSSPHLPTFSEVVALQAGQQICAYLLHTAVLVRLDSCVFDLSIHAFTAPFVYRMAWVETLLLEPVGEENTLKDVTNPGMSRVASITLLLRDSHAVVREHAADPVWECINLLPHKPHTID